MIRRFHFLRKLTMTALYECLCINASATEGITPVACPESDEGLASPKSKFPSTKMKQIIILIVLLAATAVSLPANETSTSDPWLDPSYTADFYVSLQGNDSLQGSMDKPFATVQRAMQAVREEKKKTNGGIKVILRGGIYELKEKLVFTHEDSGSEETPITYEGYPGEKVIISGGREIKGWKEATNGLWTVDIPEVKEGELFFNQLFVDGERRTRARTPNKGWHRAERILPKGFLYAGNDFDPDWSNPREAIVTINYTWEASSHYVNEIDAEKKMVKLELGGGGIPWHGYAPPFEAHQRYIIENLIEFLDAPGEWHLDRKSGRLTYMPMEGESIANTSIRVPTITPTIVEFAGDPEKDQFIDYLGFKNISFRDGGAYMPREGVQVNQAAQNQNAAIVAFGLRHSTFENCEVSCIGEHGIWLRKGSQHNTIRQSHIHDLGASAVRIGEMKRAADERLWVDYNTVDNSFLHNGGNIFRGATGLCIAQSSHNRISHNAIRCFYYTGISAGWDWSPAPSSANHNIIEFNDISHLGQGELFDMGAIYTLGQSQGTVIRNNVLRDSYAHPSFDNWSLMNIGTPTGEGMAGIYLDESTQDILVENNLVYNVLGDAWCINHGKSNRIKNNIFYDNAGGIRMNSGHNEVSVEITNNIIVSSQSRMTGGGWTEHEIINSNLYYKLGDEPYFFNGGTFQEWQQRGFGKGSILAEPGFVDAENRNFDLKRNAAAFRIGFKPFDWRKAGLYGDKEWTSLPDKIERRPDRLTEIPERSPETIDDDFDYEGASIRGVPMRCKMHSAGISITDTKSKSGTSSVMVDCKNSTPYFYYEPHFVEDTQLYISMDLFNSAERTSEIILGSRDLMSGRQIDGFWLVLGKDGVLRSDGREILKYPVGKWFKIRIDFAVGPSRSNTFTVSIDEGEKASLQIPDNFHYLNWFAVLTGAANRYGLYYIDNLKLQRSAK